jgi:hypothetical protein
MYYKYKKDFSVLSCGDHSSLVQSKNVVGKAIIDTSTVLRYMGYEEFNDATLP